MVTEAEPLVSEAEVMRLAQAHLSRRAASVLQLRLALLRKLARRFARAGGEPPDRAVVEAIVERVVDRVARAGLIDEAALAQSRAEMLVRKGLAANTIRRRLGAQGLVGDGRSIEAMATIDDEQQARRFAERKRLGPWRTGQRPASPEREMRSMLRAGFDQQIARRVLGSVRDTDVDDT